jgi:hypothetical protein
MAKSDRMRDGKFDDVTTHNSTIVTDKTQGNQRVIPGDDDSDDNFYISDFNRRENSERRGKRRGKKRQDL